MITVKFMDRGDVFVWLNGQPFWCPYDMKLWDNYVNEAGFSIASDAMSLIALGLADGHGEDPMFQTWVRQLGTAQRLMPEPKLPKLD